MSFRQTIIAAIAVLLAIPVIGIVGYRWREREGYRNYETCKSLRPGITVPDIIRQMGSPVRHQGPDGRIWLAFETPSIMAGNIRAEIDESSDKVIVLRCDEDGDPTWEVLP